MNEDPKTSIPEDTKEVEQFETFEIDTHPFLIYDLNLLVLFITSFYSIIYAELKKKFPHSKFTSWVSAFCLAAEHERNGDTSLKNEILKIMESHGVTVDDWETLQEIRNTRNALCHPRVGVNRAISILNQRWKRHHSFQSLRKMLKIVRDHTGLQSSRGNFRRRSSATSPSGSTSESSSGSTSESSSRSSSRSSSQSPPRTPSRSPRLALKSETKK